jgi:hypothetical protein
MVVVEDVFAKNIFRSEVRMEISKYADSDPKV